MVRSDTASDDSVPMTVLANFRILFDEASHEISSRFPSVITGPAAHQCCFRRSLIAPPSGGQKHNGGQKVV
jgi:hypothetical protein